MRLWVAIFVAALAPLMAEVPAADSERGAEFFKKQGCVKCHAAGQAAAAATIRRTSDYTPAGITAGLWNHAPLMWTAMEAAAAAIPQISEQDAADLFAYFYAARYFERMADAGRGKKVFEGKSCAGCHPLTGSGKGPAISRWQSTSDFFTLSAQMWNHAPQMKAAMAERKLIWPELSAQDMADIVMYIRNLPETKGAKPSFVLPPLDNGAALYKEKGCAGCHNGGLSLENRLTNQTLSDIAAALWNHAPKMKQDTPTITSGEMQQILTYVWASQFFEPTGSPTRGKRVFDSRQCGTCHQGGGSEIRGKGVYTPMRMVNVLWRHGPGMQDQMTKKNVTWPRLTPAEMLDLMAYLSEGTRRAAR
jgi:mono/diheme cytochrome c family protein